MNNHLSQDQLSMWFLGRSTSEERRHGAECPQCRAELARFEEPVTTFMNAMHDWSEHERVPRLEEVSSFLRRPPEYITGALRWAAVAMAVMLLTTIPIYRQVEALMQRAGATEDVTLSKGGPSIALEMNDDVLLMNAVSAHLSRTIPAPMEPIMALVPDSESTTYAGGTQQ
jgi:hypothetical protein